MSRYHYPDLPPFGALVQEHLDARRWLRTDLAREIGVSPSTIKTAMSGARPISAATCDVIAAALALENNELRRLAGLPPVRTAETKYDDRIEALAQRLAALPEAQREAVLRQC